MFSIVHCIDSFLSLRSQMPWFFCPQYYYEDLDVLPYTYHRHVKTLDDFHEWKSGPVLEDYMSKTHRTPGATQLHHGI